MRCSIILQLGRFPGPLENVLGTAGQQQLLLLFYRPHTEVRPRQAGDAITPFSQWPASEHRLSQGSPGGHELHKFLEYLVILCFERRYPKQNSAASLKSNNLASPKFWSGYATASERRFLFMQPPERASPKFGAILSHG